MSAIKESCLERYLRDIFDRFSISPRNQDILIGRISKHKTYYELAVQYDVSLERIRQIVMTFWGKVWVRLSVFKRSNEDEIEKAISELKKINLYNPEKIGDILKRNYVRSIIEYDFTSRVFNCFRKSGIETIDQVVDKTEKDLLLIRNLGKKSIREIKGVLSKHGYSLKEEGKL